MFITSLPRSYQEPLVTYTPPLSSLKPDPQPRGSVQAQLRPSELITCATAVTSSLLPGSSSLTHLPSSTLLMGNCSKCRYHQALLLNPLSGSSHPQHKNRTQNLVLPAVSLPLSPLCTHIYSSHHGERLALSHPLNSPGMRLPEELLLPN